MNDLSANNLLTQATCAVLVGDKIAGTAWLFSHQGHLLTAGHVLGKKNPSRQVDIHVQFLEDRPRKAHIVYHEYWEKRRIDFAILQLDSVPHNRRPLPISLAQFTSGKFILYGYGTSLNSLSSGIGQFTGVDIKESASDKLFLLRSQEIAEKGYSGGAVFSDEAQAVVAIQTETATRRMGARRDTVRAMPLYRIANIWPRLKRLATISPSAQPNPQPTRTNILFTHTQTGQFTSTLPREVQHALNECFARHRPLILRVAPNDASVNAQLDALHRAFLTNRLDLINTIKSVLTFFTPHSSALIELNRLLQEPTLQWLVRQRGEHITKSYEHLVFTTITTLPFCTNCGTRASKLTTRFCSRCGKPMH